MTLEQALAISPRIETNWATNFEHGWVELEVEEEQLIDPDTNIWVEVPPERTRR